MALNSLPELPGMMLSSAPKASNTRSSTFRIRLMILAESIPKILYPGVSFAVVMVAPRVPA
ncbi:hypothetical protein D3C83_108620 [compost metagenome]